MGNLNVEELIAEINALAKKNKEVGLTDDEIAHRHELRQTYLSWFRQNMKKQLDNIEIEVVDDARQNNS